MKAGSGSTGLPNPCSYEVTSLRGFFSLGFKPQQLNMPWTLSNHQGVDSVYRGNHGYTLTIELWNLIIMIKQAALSLSPSFSLNQIWAK